MISQTDDSGAPQLVIAESRESIRNPGGRIGAIIELGSEILPEILDQLDELAIGLLTEWNRIHSTATSNLTPQNSFISETVIPSQFIDVNLDDDALLNVDGGRAGITAAVQPVFGNRITGLSDVQNVTINVVDEATGVAEKYVVRYDPENPTFPQSRSLSSLVEAINTGRGGGFTVYPPQPDGVAGVQAVLVPVDGGFRLDLNAASGKLIDFAPALETRPADQSWTNPAVTVTATATDPALANERLWLRVNGGNMEAYTIDDNGNEVAYGAPVAITAAGGPFAVGNVALSFANEAVEYTNGDQFAVDFNSFGDIRSGPSVTRDQEWSTANAGFQVSGRYEGAQL